MQPAAQPTAPKPKGLNDPLLTFRTYQIIIAIICITIPAFLKLYDVDVKYPISFEKKGSGIETVIIKDTTCRNGLDFIICKDGWGFRKSVSDYAYSSNSYLFGMFLCIAAMLFIFNGAVYFRGEKRLRLISQGKWYNVVLGISLLAVICFPHRDWPTLHYVFAGLFFIGNAVVTAVFHNKKDTKKRIVMAILTIMFLFFAFVVERGWIKGLDHLKKNTFTILWGEWLSLTVIGFHFILEAMAAAPKVRISH